MAESTAPRPSRASLNLDRYCVRCGTDKHVREVEDHHLLWCDVCWNWQKPIPHSLRKYIENLEGEAHDSGE